LKKSSKSLYIFIFFYLSDNNYLIHPTKDLLQRQNNFTW